MLHLVADMFNLHNELSMLKFNLLNSRIGRFLVPRPKMSYKSEVVITVDVIIVGMCLDK